MDNLGPRLGQKQVHIVPLGYEYDRIIDPLQHSADIVYLLIDDPTTDSKVGTVDFNASCETRETDPASWVGTTDYQREVREEISTFADVGGYPVQLDDFHDVMGVVTTIAAHHEADSPNGDNVFVNISSGPHIAAVAAAVGCMAVGARPYSIEPESYAHDHKAKPRTQGARSLYEIPMHPIKPPTKDQITVLEYVHEQTNKGHSVNKSIIIRNFEDNSEEEGPILECLQNSGTKTRSSKYGQLDSKILDDLRENGYIEIEQRGRSKYIEVTESGRSILASFGHLLP